MTILTKEQQQEILKGLLKLATEKNVKEFEKKLKAAKEAGFDFFNTRLSEPYELDGDLLLQGASLIEDILVKHYPKELIEIFFKEEIITRNNIENLYSYINGSNDFTQLNLNFIKFSLNYISNERIQVDQNVFDNICKAVKNTMINSFSKCGESQYSAVQDKILDIEEVVILLLPLLDENKREKFKNGFDKLKNKVQALFKPTTSTSPQQKQTISGASQKVASNPTPLQQPPVNPETVAPTAPQQTEPVKGDPQKVTGSAAPFEEILIDNETNNNLESEKQDNEPPITTHNSKQEHFLGISTRGWIIISACAIAGALVLYFLAPLILGALGCAVSVGAELGLGAAGAVAGGVIGGGMACLTQIVISKYCGEEAAAQPA